MIFTLGAFNIQASTDAHTVAHCTTSLKIAGSIPDAAIVFLFIDIILLAALWPLGRLRI
jgi:hypothetical protein